MKFISKKFTLIGTLFLIVVTPLSIISCSFEKWESRLIINVHDGDTFTASNNKIYRLLGVDTPEISSSNIPTTGLEYFYAQKATHFAKSRLLNRKVEFLDHTIDKYSRVVSRIKIINIDLSTQLVKMGLARVGYISYDFKNIYYYDDFDFIKNLQENQKFARENKMGFWENEDNIKQIFPKQNITVPQ